MLVMQDLHLCRVILILVRIMILRHRVFLATSTFAASMPETDYGNAYDFNHFRTNC